MVTVDGTEDRVRGLDDCSWSEVDVLSITSVIIGSSPFDADEDVAALTLGTTPGVEEI